MMPPLRRLEKRSALTPSIQAGIAIAILLAINGYFVKKLFFVEFTNNMQTNIGSFLAITRYILRYFPHLNWFPWVFNGVPFENSYTPMLHLIDAAFARITGASPARSFNFVTAFFYAIGPATLFYFAWRISGLLKPSFFAALLYSLFSPVVIFDFYRRGMGIWDSWRLPVLIYWGEGPHIAVVALLPISILLFYRAITTRKYPWCVAAGASFGLLAITNSFGQVDLAIACASLILVLPRKEIVRSALLTLAIATAAYLWISPFLTPSELRTISYESQFVDGDFRFIKLLPAQCIVLAGFAAVWLATMRMRNAFLRFCLLFGFVFYAIVALDAVAHMPALPQPHRYSVEMEMALSLAAVFALAPLAARLTRAAKVIGIVLILAAGIHQLQHFHRQARALSQPLDVTQTTDYKAAQFLDRNYPGLRAFVSGETGTWLNAFTDIPQLNSGHEPFNPNPVLDAVIYAIYSDQNAGDRGADISITWLKAFGCHTIHIAPSRIYGQIFGHPHKFDGVLPLVWQEGNAAIYEVPQRSKSLAHVTPPSAIVADSPINGLDIHETAGYVSALDDASLPEAPLTWINPGEARIETTLHPGQVISVQSTYDKGWLSTANGRPAPVTRDGLGLSVIHADCDGPCSVDFFFDGGLERKVCRALSWTVSIAALIGLFVFRRRGENPAA